MTWIIYDKFVEIDNISQPNYYKVIVMLISLKIFIRKYLKFRIRKKTIPIAREESIDIIDKKKCLLILKDK